MAYESISGKWALILLNDGSTVSGKVTNVTEHFIFVESILGGHQINKRNVFDYTLTAN